MAEGKRPIILCVFLILFQETDENHPLTQVEIANRIKDKWDVDVGRKSVSNAIDVLNDCFIDGEIEFEKTKNGAYCSVRPLDYCQITYLADSIFNNKALSTQEAKSFLEGLRYFHPDFNKSIKAREDQLEDVDRAEKYHCYENYKIIIQALEEKTQITFKYVHHYDENNKETLTTDVYTKQPKKFNLSPFYLIMGNNGKHYVIGSKFKDKPNQLASYKIEYMRDLEIKRKYERKSKQEAFGDAHNFKIGKFLRERPKMFLNESPVDCDVLIKHEKGTIYIRDELGPKMKVKKQPDGLHYLFKATPSSLKLIGLDYYNYIEIIKPESVREELKKASNAINDIYNK